MKDLEQLELRISQFLRIGVVAAGAMMLMGIVATFKLSGDPFFNFQVYDQISLKELLELHVKNGQYGVLISYLGLITLISLPFIRVLLTAVLFLKQREYLLALISSVVLLGLVVSFTLGLEH
ncbi:MAG TPA: DUF1634 domain-containing protein [Bacteriovoracaceae bacterium]|nr:DUF1634 domain-containing protein [Bacteriovoracaceae bacterium]